MTLVHLLLYDHRLRYTRVVEQLIQVKELPSFYHIFCESITKLLFSLVFFQTTISSNTGGRLNQTKYIRYKGNSKFDCSNTEKH